MKKTTILGFDILVLFLLFLLPFNSSADSMDKYQIGGHGQGHAKLPTWFKQSLLDLQGDLEDARDSGKRGIIIMFSQENCSHCQAFIETTLQNKETKKRIQTNYDVIGLDIFNDNELTYIDGTVTTVKDFAEATRARLTPTLLFIGVENKVLLKIIGLYPPEKFNHVLDFIEKNYYQSMKLRDYLQKVKLTNEGKLRPVKFDASLFENSPINLNKTSDKNRPLLVVFENPNCNPCDRFHQRVLADENVKELLGKFRAVQIDATDNTQKITSPNGTLLAAKDWASQLQLNYEIAIVFFDTEGKEVHRIDSEFGKDRMIGSMQYVLEKEYTRHEQFLQWRKEQAIKKMKNSD